MGSGGGTGGDDRRHDDDEEANGGIIRLAAELYEADIRFRRSPTASLHDITFRRSVLTLPFVVVDDSTEYTFLNLMAFERLHAGDGNDVTAYVFFMENISSTVPLRGTAHLEGDHPECRRQRQGGGEAVQRDLQGRLAGCRR
uniref:Uncharacterized protein n=1 Tax=Oryza punctata TaxID=4537 RepID=A0A0E0MME1_ORYPU